MHGRSGLPGLTLSGRISPYISERSYLTLYQWAVVSHLISVSGRISPYISERSYLTLYQWAVVSHLISVSGRISPYISERSYLTLYQWAVVSHLISVSSPYFRCSFFMKKDNTTNTRVRSLLSFNLTLYMCIVNLQGQVTVKSFLMPSSAFMQCNLPLFKFYYHQQTLEISKILYTE